MASRWMNRVVILKHMDGGGWRCIAIDGQWIGCKALDEKSRTLAAFTPDGVVWFKKRDLLEVTHQQETLT